MRLVALLLLASTASTFGAIGDTQAQCNEKYGRVDSSADYEDAGGRITVEKYKAPKSYVEVVFNKTGVATEIRFLGPKPADIPQLLKTNGQNWTKEKPKLGSAMDARRFERWTTPDGRVANYEKARSTVMWLIIYSPERLAQLKARGVEGIPKPDEQR